MNKNEELIKQVFDIISRLKRANMALHNEADDDIRPSEEMFIVKIDMLSKDNIAKVSDLVNVLRLAPSTVSTILKSLEDNGYVIREKSNDNRREVYVSLTDKGKERLNIAKKLHFEMIDELFSYLGKDDALKLIEILDKTAGFLEYKKKIKEKSNNDKNN